MFERELITFAYYYTQPQIEQAHFNRDVRHVLFLLNNGNCLAPDEINLTLCWAACHGFLNVVRYAVRCGADPQWCGNYAFRWASYYGHLEIVQFLARSDAGVSGKAWKWALKYAQEQGRTRVVCYLTQYGDSLNSTGTGR